MFTPEPDPWNGSGERYGLQVGNGVGQVRIESTNFGRGGIGFVVVRIENQCFGLWCCFCPEDGCRIRDIKLNGRA